MNKYEWLLTREISTYKQTESHPVPEMRTDTAKSKVTQQSAANMSSC